MGESSFSLLRAASFPSPCPVAPCGGGCKSPTQPHGETAGSQAHPVDLTLSTPWARAWAPACHAGRWPRSCLLQGFKPPILPGAGKGQGLGCPQGWPVTTTEGGCPEHMSLLCGHHQHPKGLCSGLNCTGLWDEPGSAGNTHIGPRARLLESVYLAFSSPDCMCLGSRDFVYLRLIINSDKWPE